MKKQDKYTTADRFHNGQAVILTEAAGPLAAGTKAVVIRPPKVTGYLTRKKHVDEGDIFIYVKVSEEEHLVFCHTLEPDPTVRELEYQREENAPLPGIDFPLSDIERAFVEKTHAQALALTSAQWSVVFSIYRDARIRAMDKNYYSLINDPDAPSRYYFFRNIPKRPASVKRVVALGMADVFGLTDAGTKIAQFLWGVHMDYIETITVEYLQKQINDRRQSDARFAWRELTDNRPYRARQELDYILTEEIRTQIMEDMHKITLDFRRLRLEGQASRVLRLVETIALGHINSVLNETLIGEKPALPEIGTLIVTAVDVPNARTWGRREIKSASTGRVIDTFPDVNMVLAQFENEENAPERAYIHISQLTIKA